jgi:hypothetical protein
MQSEIKVGQRFKFNIIVRQPFARAAGDSNSRTF